MEVAVLNALAAHFEPHQQGKFPFQLEAHKEIGICNKFFVWVQGTSLSETHMQIDGILPVSAQMRSANLFYFLRDVSRQMHELSVSMSVHAARRLKADPNDS